GRIDLAARPFVLAAFLEEAVELLGPRAQNARAAGTPYDRVLMDQHIPGMDGIEATRRIRAIEAEQEAPRTPILALTANASAEDRDACLGAGMDGFLVKPLDRERLSAALAAGSGAALAA